MPWRRISPIRHSLLVRRYWKRFGGIHNNNASLAATLTTTHGATDDSTLSSTIDNKNQQPPPPPSFAEASLGWNAAVALANKDCLACTEHDRLEMLWRGGEVLVGTAAAEGAPPPLLLVGPHLPPPYDHFDTYVSPHNNLHRHHTGSRAGFSCWCGAADRRSGLGGSGRDVIIGGGPTMAAHLLSMQRRGMVTAVRDGIKAVKGSSTLLHGGQGAQGSAHTKNSDTGGGGGDVELDEYEQIGNSNAGDSSSSHFGAAAVGAKSTRSLHDVFGVHLPAAQKWSALTVGVPKEIVSDEKSVAVTPEVAAELVKAGMRVVIEFGAGTSAGFTDDAYVAGGAQLVECVWKTSNVIIKIQPPAFNRHLDRHELDLIQPHATLLSLFYPDRNYKLISLLQQKRCTAFALDCMPRLLTPLSAAATTTADPASAVPIANPAITPTTTTAAVVIPDILSEMSRLAGYRATMRAMYHLGRLPRRVLVLGADASGLSVIQTAVRLGAEVLCCDHRAAARAEAQAFGATLIDHAIPPAPVADGDCEPSFAYISALRALLPDALASADVVVGAFAVPGKAAPKLVTREMIPKMAPGSVIIDLMAEAGGNVETAILNETVVVHGVTHFGYSTSRNGTPQDISTAFAKTALKFFTHLGGGGTFAISLESPLVQKTLVTTNGAALWSVPGPSRERLAARVARKERRELLRTVVATTAGTAVGAAVCAAVVACPALAGPFTVFTLSCLGAGMMVSKVRSGLRAPLMGVTNAISGLVILGGLALVGSSPSSPVVYGLALTSVWIASVNIFAEFTITRRMIDVFTRTSDPRDFTFLLLVPTTGLLLVAGGMQFAGLAAAGPLLNGVNLTASLLCAASLAGLAHARSARRTTALSIIGTKVAIGGALVSFMPTLSLAGYAALVCAIAAGTVGTKVANSVGFVGVPPLVAAAHSFAGIADIAICFAAYLHGFDASAAVASPHAVDHAVETVHVICIWMCTVLGGITFTGSLAAFMKLQGFLSAEQSALPGLKTLNVGCFAVYGGCLAALLHPAAAADPTLGLLSLGVATVVSCAQGFIVVMGIRAANVPVAMTFFNGSSGWAMAAEGVKLGSDLCIVTGALVGSSGAFLTYTMCTLLNKTPMQVFFAKPTQRLYVGDVQTTTCEAVAADLLAARRVMIVVGHGMAIDKAQYSVADIFHKLKSRGVDVTVAIHPIAGRMPGQLNVFIAEAKIPWDCVHDVLDVNDQFSHTDFVLVVGANDTINIAAVSDPDSPIAGLQVSRVWEAHQVCILETHYVETGPNSSVTNRTYLRGNVQLIVGDTHYSCRTIHNELHRLIDAGTV